MNIFVLTTATPRKALHDVTLYPVVRLLQQHFKVTFVANLDNPKTFSREDVEETRKALQEYDARIIETSTGGSFSLAARNLYKTVDSMQSSENNIFWLEDDWVLQEPDKLLTAIETFMVSSDQCILTTTHNHLGGNPCLFKQNLFDKIVEEWNKTSRAIDPEVLHFRAKQSLCGDESLNTPFDEYIHLPDCFTDAGRFWREERNIKKANKYHEKQTTWYT